MNFKELKQKSLPHFYSIKIDNFLSRQRRKVLRMTLALLALLSFTFSFDSLPLHFGSADGFFFLFIISFLLLFFIELFYRSMAGEGFYSELSLDYALSDLIFHTDEIDASRAIFESKTGLSILGRLGVPREVSQKFIYENRVPVVASIFEFTSPSVTLSDYISLLYDTDKSLQAFLSKNSISKEMFLAASKEISKFVLKRRTRERFWERGNLGSIPSVGSNPFFEVAETKIHSNKFISKTPLSELDIYSIKSDEEVSRLELFLSRDSSVAFISESADDVEEKVKKLSKKISLGVAMPEIEHKKLLSFDVPSFFASVEKGEWLAKLSDLFKVKENEDRIIFIKDFSFLLLKLREVKADPAQILFPKGLQLLVFSNQADYKFFVEPSEKLSKKFSIISLS